MSWLKSLKNFFCGKASPEELDRRPAADSQRREKTLRSERAVQRAWFPEGQREELDALGRPISEEKGRLLGRQQKAGKGPDPEP